MYVHTYDTYIETTYLMQEKFGGKSLPNKYH